MNPFIAGTKDHDDWQRGFSQAAWAAPANNASAAQWMGYHAAARS